MKMIINYLMDIFKMKSPCCKIKMESCFNMEMDFLVYECKCGKTYF
jgi:hypothetical protein